MPKNYFNFPTLFPLVRKNNRRAFTLVEVLVVIGIIAVLSALVITALNPAQLRRAARDTNRQKDLGIISTALEQFYADHNQYPNETDVDCLEESLENVAASGCSGNHASGTVYIKVMPRGQTNRTEYCYNRYNAQNFVLCAPREQDLAISADPNACTPGAPAGVTGALGAAGGYGSICVTNPF